MAPLRWSRDGSVAADDNGHEVTLHRDVRRGCWRVCASFAGGEGPIRGTAETEAAARELAADLVERLHDGEAA